MVRGDDRLESDIDTMVQTALETGMDLLRYVGIVQHIQARFQSGLDLANRERLKPAVRPSVERDAVYAF